MDEKKKAEQSWKRKRVQGRILRKGRGDKAPGGNSEAREPALGRKPTKSTSEKKRMIKWGGGSRSLGSGDERGIETR